MLQLSSNEEHFPNDQSIKSIVSEEQDLTSNTERSVPIYLQGALCDLSPSNDADDVVMQLHHAAQYSPNNDLLLHDYPNTVYSSSSPNFLMQDSRYPNEIYDESPIRDDDIIQLHAVDDVSPCTIVYESSGIQQNLMEDGKGAFEDGQDDEYLSQNNIDLLLDGTSVANDDDLFFDGFDIFKNCNKNDEEEPSEIMCNDSLSEFIDFEKCKYVNVITANNQFRNENNTSQLDDSKLLLSNQNQNEENNYSESVTEEIISSIPVPQIKSDIKRASNNMLSVIKVQTNKIKDNIIIRKSEDSSIKTQTCFESINDKEGFKKKEILIERLQLEELMKKSDIVVTSLSNVNEFKTTSISKDVKITQVSQNDSLVITEGVNASTTMNQNDQQKTGESIRDEKKDDDKFAFNKNENNTVISNNPQDVKACLICGKVFGNPSALTKHKLTHSNERKYVCSTCGKAFKRQDHLNGHLLTHRNKKPFECKIDSCDKSYCDARSLRRHTENHHPKHVQDIRKSSATKIMTSSCIQYAPAVVDSNRPKACRRNARKEKGLSANEVALIKALIHPSNQQSLINDKEQVTKKDLLITQGNMEDRIAGENKNNPSEAKIKSRVKKVPPKVSKQNNGVSTTANESSGRGIPLSTAKKVNSDTDAKPVQCSICQRRFKNIPALNGHMRLHGGYYKKENDAKKNEKKESTGPPLQTASIGVRALIEEKIIRKRISKSGLTLQTCAKLMPASPEAIREMSSSSKVSVPFPSTTSSSIIHQSLPTTSFQNQSFQMTQMSPLHITISQTPSPQLSYVQSPINHQLPVIHNPSLHTPPLLSPTVQIPSMPSYHQIMTSPLHTPPLPNNDSQPKVSSFAIPAAPFPSFYPILKEEYVNDNIDAYITQQGDAMEINNTNLAVDQKTDIDMSYHSQTNGVDGIRPEMSIYHQSSNNTDYFPNIFNNDVSLYPGIDETNQINNINISDEPLNQMSQEEYEKVATDMQQQLEDVFDGNLPVIFNDYSYIHTETVITSYDTSGKTYTNSSPLPSPEFVYPTPPASQEGRSPSFGPIYHAAMQTRVTSPLSSFYSSGMSSPGTVEAALNEVLSMDIEQNHHSFPITPESSPISVNMCQIQDKYQSQTLLNGSILTSPAEYSQNRQNVNLKQYEESFFSFDEPRQLTDEEITREIMEMESYENNMNEISLYQCSKVILLNKAEVEVKKEVDMEVNRIKIEMPSNEQNSTESLPFKNNTKKRRKSSSEEEEMKCRPRFQSQLRMHCSTTNQSTSYTPFPMLDPLRHSTGLYWKSIVPQNPKISTNNILVPKNELEIESDVQPHVNIGPDFQADISECKAEESNRDSGQLMWFPSAITNVTDAELEVYLEFACSSAVPYIGRNKEHALRLLHLCNGNVQTAVIELMRKVLKINPCNSPIYYEHPKTNLWTHDEIQNFQIALYNFDKNFAKVSQQVNTKGIKDCVQFYYTWKMACPSDYKKMKIHWKDMRSHQPKLIRIDNIKSPEDRMNAISSVSSATGFKGRRYSCEFANCRAKFQSKNALSGHLKIHGAQFSEKARTNVPNTVNTSIPTPSFTFETSEKFPCKLCGKIFNKVKSRSAHMKSHRISETEARNKAQLKNLEFASPLSLTLDYKP